MPFFVLCLISAICVYGDVLLKQAGELSPTDPIKFLAAAWIYGGSTFGWLYVLSNMELKTVGITYPVVQCLLLTAVGVLWAHEAFGVRDALGILLGLLSVALLNK